jgi:hypothetical protein
MSIPHFKNTQGAGAGKLLISHLCKDDNVGQIISDSLDALQIHAGTTWPVLSQDRTQIRRYVCGTKQPDNSQQWHQSHLGNQTMGIQQQCL